MPDEKELEAAIERLLDPERFSAAERVVAQAAPQLQKVLAGAMAAGGWFGEPHEAEALKAATVPDPDERIAAVRALLAEEARMGMMVGVAVGWALQEEMTDPTDPEGEREMEIKFHGQSCFELSDGEATLLIDPFLKPNNPAAVHTGEEVEPTHIALTHGHADHVADAIPVAQRTGAHCVAIVELAEWLKGAGIEAVSDPNLGGTVSFDWGSIKLVPAWHTSTIPGSEEAPFSAEHGTAIGTATGLIMPIGGHYTMDRHDAVAAVEMIGAGTVIPMHYDTFPPIETDAGAFKADVEAQTSSQVVLLKPGETHSA